MDRNYKWCRLVQKCPVYRSFCSPISWTKGCQGRHLIERGCQLAAFKNGSTAWREIVSNADLLMRLGTRRRSTPFSRSRSACRVIVSDLLKSLRITPAFRRVALVKRRALSNISSSSQRISLWPARMSSSSLRSSLSTCSTAARAKLSRRSAVSRPISTRARLSLSCGGVVVFSQPASRFHHACFVLATLAGAGDTRPPKTI